MGYETQLIDGETLFIACTKIGKRFKHICTKAVEDYCLTPNEIEIVWFLSKNKVRDTAKEIVDYLGISKSLVCRSAESLEAKGYIKCTKDVRDRRVCHLKLEPSAHEIVRKLNKGTKIFYQEAFEGIIEEEKFAFKSTLDKMIGNILSQ